MTALQGTAGVALWTLVLAALVLLAYAGMLRGWRRRAARHDLPAPARPSAAPQTPAATVTPTDGVTAAPTRLEATGRYFGTTLAGDWLDRVVAHGLGTRSPARLCLDDAGLDVHRPSGSFHVDLADLDGARHDQGIAGKVVPPHGILVLTWRLGEHRLDSGFRLDDSAAHEQWVAAVARTAKEQHA